MHCLYYCNVQGKVLTVVDTTYTSQNIFIIDKISDEENLSIPSLSYFLFSDLCLSASHKLGVLIR